MMKQIFYLFIFLSLLISCISNNELQKINEAEFLDLIKKDSFYSKIYKIRDLEGNFIAREEMSNYPISDYFSDYYFNEKKDSIIVNLRKRKPEDKITIQKIEFYNTYRNYVDTIYAKIKIDCSNVDLLLQKAFEADQLNRNEHEEINVGIDAQNQKILINIIEQCGFPNSNENKKESVSNAFLILLHSDYQIQKQYYKDVVQAIKVGDLRKSDIAYLEDKMALALGEKQIYGTQYNYEENGEILILPTDDLNKVNERRKKIGLPILESN